MKVGRILVSLFLVLVTLPALGLSGAVHASPVHSLNSNYFGEDIGNANEYVFSFGSITIEDMSVSDLFDFTADANNDVYWYPGVVHVDQTSPTTYDETLDFGGGFTVISHLEILAEVEDNFVVQKATGAFENYAIYQYQQVGDDAKLSIYAAVKEGPGVDAATIQFIQSTAFQNLLNYLNVVGSYSVHVV